jgi:hypothetical protein
MVAPSVARSTLRTEAEAPLPFWPIVAMVVGYPLWFVLGLSGFMWVVLALPMAASLSRRRGLLVPRGSGWWLVFLVAVVGSALSLDSTARFFGWGLRFGYYIGASLLLLYILNGRRGVDVFRVIRVFTILWMITVVGGYLAFPLGDLSFRAPTYYVTPGFLRENELIKAWLVPSFAQVQDIIGVPVPRPKAPFTYTNEWGSMLALLTPFGFMAMYDRRVGFSPRLVRFVMAASVVPAVISLNRGLWLSLGLGVVYAAVRFGVAGERKLLIQGLWASVVLVVVLSITPLGGVIATRINTGHSNDDRAELAVSAVEGAAEKPFFGWGAPRPNERNLPSIGTHGQLWFVTFSHGFLGALGFVGSMLSIAWYTRRQLSTVGLWAHVVIVIGIIQMPYYLMMPDQLFTVFAAAAIALRLQSDGGVSVDPSPV